MARRYAIPFAVLLAALVSCDSSTGSDPEPAQVQVVGGNGQTGAPSGLLADSLAVKVVYADGQPVPQATVAWTVSSGGGTLSTATATTNAAGVAKAAWTLGAAGPNVVTATVGSLPPASFAAYAVPVASVTLSSATVRVGKGDTTKLVATLRDSTGAELAGRTVAWSTSSAATAVVSDAGIITGKALGTATITATSEGKSATAGVTVTTEDLTFPVLAGFSFSPSQVDVTAGAQTVEVLVHATDGGSGVDNFWVALLGPSPAPFVSCGGPSQGNGELASGTPEDGVWKCTATLPKGSTAGIWKLAQVNLADVAGNLVGYTQSKLVDTGLPTTLTVVNTAPPPTPPALTGLSFTPGTVNVGAADATMEVAFTATADAGVREVYVNVQAPRSEPTGGVNRGCTETTPATGTSTSGTWKCSFTIPRHSAGGTWNVNAVSVADSAGNSTVYTSAQLTAAGLPGSFQVVSPSEDITAPVLTGLTVSPTTVSLANGAAQVQVTVTATDAGAGANYASSALSPPTGTTQECDTDPVTGLPQQNATFVCSILVPAVAAEGKWSLSIFVVDAVGNYRHYTSNLLKDAGLTYEVTVTR
jgi:hypothetical protein